jgi:hypothetical protein
MDIDAGAAVAVAALQKCDGLNLRQIFARTVDESVAHEVMGVLVERGNVAEIDGKYWLRHSRLPSRPAASPKAAAPVPQPAPKRPGRPEKLGYDAETAARVQLEREAILSLLVSAGAGMQLRDIVARAGLPMHSVVRRLETMVRQGKVKKIGRGEYAALDCAAPALVPSETNGAKRPRPKAEKKAAYVAVSDAALTGEDMSKSCAQPFRAATLDMLRNEHLHPVLVGLLRMLPPAGTAFRDKDRFVVAWTACMDFVYPDTTEAAS